MPVGTVVWLASEVMFFSGLFGAYFALRAATPGDWPPPDVELDRVVSGLFTALLVASSGTLQLGVRAMSAGRRQSLRRWLGVTALLAVAFLANQAHEWATVDFSISSHPFGSTFFVMTGFHGLHVAGGVVAMLVLAARASSARFDAAELPAVETVSYYWHFVDVVWVAMWSTLFLLA